MLITEQDIKRLWGRAAGRCSMPGCRKQLCPYPTPGVILGEMCHIVAESPKGPRGKSRRLQKKINEYQNLILLCSEHHIIIDAYTRTWTVQRLHKVKQDHERWVEEHLRQGTMKADVADAIRRIDRFLTRQRWLHGLIWADIVNARFLQSLQESEDAIWFNLNTRKEFRDLYLDMLDKEYGNTDNTPFGFSWLNALIIFPDEYNRYKNDFPGLHISKPDCPTLLQDLRPFQENGKWYWQVEQVIPVPFLPTHNGFIWSRDETTALPNDVRKDPCEDFWGAYYWVRPYGIRAVIIGIGVLDPMECANGTAIWYSPKDKRPFIGVRPAKVATPEFLRQMDNAVRASYIDILKKHG